MSTRATVWPAAYPSLGGRPRDPPRTLEAGRPLRSFSETVSHSPPHCPWEAVRGQLPVASQALMRCRAFCSALRTELQGRNSGLLSRSGSSATGHHTLALQSSSLFGFGAIVFVYWGQEYGGAYFLLCYRIKHLNIKVILCILTSQINQTLPCVLCVSLILWNFIFSFIKNIF